MPVKGFQIIAIEAKRHNKARPQSQVRIDHNTTIISVKSNTKNEISVEIRYTVSYGLLGIVQLDCEVKYSEKEDLTEAVKKWELKHKLADNIAEAVHNKVLAQGSFEVLNIAKKMNLPPPFKIEIPQIKIGKGEEKKNKNNSPEIA